MIGGLAIMVLFILADYPRKPPIRTHCEIRNPRESDSLWLTGKRRAMLAGFFAGIAGELPR